MRVALVLVGVGGLACTADAPPDPRKDAQELYDVHMRAEEAFASADAPDECPTRFVSYGTNTSSVSQVIEYFEHEGLEQATGVPNDFGKRPRWTGERLVDGVPQSQVDVWRAPDNGHNEWETLFSIATARCELITSATYTVTPRRVPYGSVPLVELANEGDLVVGYGLDHKIQNRVGGRWRRVPARADDGLACGIPAILKLLQPGDSDELRIGLCDPERRLGPGHYRVLTDISFEEYTDTTLRASFRITK